MFGAQYDKKVMQWSWHDFFVVLAPRTDFFVVFGQTYDKKVIQIRQKELVHGGQNDKKGRCMGGKIRQNKSVHGWEYIKVRHTHTPNIGR